MPPLLLLRRPHPLTLGLSLSALALSTPFQRRPLLCDPLPSTLSESSIGSARRSAQVPIFKDGRPNPAALKQVTAGSIFGLLAGVAVASFSKTLTALFGLLIFGIQYAASKGYNIIPTTRLQRYVKGIDLRSAVEDNVAFKLSFGVTSIVAALARF